MAALLWLAGGTLFRLPGPRPVAQVGTPTALPVLTSAEAYFARGDDDFDQGNYEQAIADYSRAIELKPDYAEAYNNRAYTYMKVENYAPALPDLDRAIRLRPDYVNALMNRGDIYNYYYQVDPARAIADYDRVIALGPEAIEHSAVCGHRLVALNNGMNLGLWLSVVVNRKQVEAETGCPTASPED
jgi:tetratricopeptide (TPR) repeat protein